MMNRIDRIVIKGPLIRFGYTFDSEKAVKFFDIVMRNKGTAKSEEELLWLAWYSAHKFGSRMTSANLASCGDGIFRGERALEAAEFVDREVQSFKERCPQHLRSIHVAEFESVTYPEAEAMFNVSFERIRR